MAKIIDINEEIVSIGTDDGKIIEISANELNFVPHVQDEVEVFKTNTKTIISKVEKKSAGDIPGGININLTNAQSTANAVSQNVSTPVVVGKRTVNKMVYCLLAFFLGGLGAHKFYAGKTFAGILYLIFCWTFVPEFLGICEAIIGLIKPADANGNIVV